MIALHIPELLMLASVAASRAGLPVLIDTEAGPQILQRKTADAEWYVAWQPDQDDGESRRLEVALDLTVTQDSRMACAWAGVEAPGASGQAEIIERYEAYANHGGDKLAATRLAVLIVAAELGRADQ